MRRPFTAALAIAIALPAASASAQGVNYHAAQQAGKVWGDKIGENNRRAAAGKSATDRRPATPAELQASRTRHRAAYDRLVDSVGTKNADKWLDWRARTDRREFPAAGKRSASASASASRPQSAAKASPACSLASWTPDQRRRLEAEFAQRMRRDGKESAGAWAREQGRLQRVRLEAQGLC